MLCAFGIYLFILHFIALLVFFSVPLLSIYCSVFFTTTFIDTPLTTWWGKKEEKLPDTILSIVALISADIPYYYSIINQTY